MIIRLFVDTLNQRIKRQHEYYKRYNYMLFLYGNYKDLHVPQLKVDCQCSNNGYIVNVVESILSWIYARQPIFKNQIG